MCAAVAISARFAARQGTSPPAPRFLPLRSPFIRQVLPPQTRLAIKPESECQAGDADGKSVTRADRSIGRWRIHVFDVALLGPRLRISRAIGHSATRVGPRIFKSSGLRRDSKR